jgi:hypothetical protein
MKNRLVLATVLLACAFPLRGEENYFQVDLVPSGRLIAKDAPVAKGSMVLFHKYPDGTLISIRRSEVKQVTRISAQSAASTNPAARVVAIGNLAMQGGSAQGGPTNASAAGAAKPPALGKGFYSAVVPGQTQGLPNSPNDYQIGRTFAGPPSNAVIPVPGAPPTNPAANTGGNPPTMNPPQ